MDIFSISYLMRYIFLILIVSIALKLLISAIKELKWSRNHSLRPVQGYFLLNQQSDGTTSSLPLYHTTNIGRAAGNDLRIHSKEVLRNHAVIYRYDKNWYIRPQSINATIRINDAKVKEQTLLNNGDVIDFGPANFAFVDEHKIAEDRGEVYEESIYDDAAFLKAVRRNSSPLNVQWFFANVFALIVIALIYFMMPEVKSVRQDYLIYTGAAVFIINLTALILPNFLRYTDKVLFLAISLLSLVGLAVQGRLFLIGNPYYQEAVKAGVLAEIEKTASTMFSGYKVQVLALLISLALLWFIAIIVAKTRLLENLVYVCAALTPLFLIITLILGRGADTHGATLWINLGGFSLQLTEFAKITYLITLASFFKNRPPLREQIYFAGWAAVVFFLYLLLPDMGSLMILLPVTLIVFVIMTSEYFKTFLIMLSAMFISVVAYGIFPHIRRRIEGWSTLWEEVNDANRQVVYGLQAMARGNFFGKGLGNGSPGGIPLAKSDMVFSIVCEEFGLIVGLAVFLLLFIVILRGFRTNVLARDGFTSSLALGLGAAIFIEAFVVIGGTTGLFPLTGATIPFIAQGGSSMLAKWIMVALLIGLAARHEEGAK